MLYRGSKSAGGCSIHGNFRSTSARRIRVYRPHMSAGIIDRIRRLRLRPLLQQPPILRISSRIMREADLPLLYKTPDTWARSVLAQPLELLNDHAHLEKK